MPGLFEDIVTGRSAPRAPTVVEDRRQQMRSTGESIESADVNQAQGRTNLAVDTQVVPADIVKRRADSRRAVLETEQAEREAPRPGGLPAIPGASETKTRIGLGLGAAIEAQNNMFAEEGWVKRNGRGRNPYLSSPGAVIAKLTDRIPMTGLIGGPSFQRYQQAGKSWESAFLPIFSGAQVSPSEALRQIKARLPAPDDLPEILMRKDTERMMMNNGAADMMSQPRPHPEVGVLYPDPEKGVSDKPPPGVRPILTLPKPKVGGLPAGFKFLGEVK